ncbi:MAG: hypothetical protein ABEJ44_03265 [Halanaeroarchaeum sp.]
MVIDDRGQAHTLEGIAATLLILSSVVFALQVTAVTPLTASTASQHVETQYERATIGVLTIAAEKHRLSSTLRYWNASGARFHEASKVGYYVGRAPPTAFGDQLRAAFDGAAVAYNVDVTYLQTDGSLRNRRVAHFGDPSNTAVTVRRTVVLYDTQPVLDSSGEPTDATLDGTTFFAPDAFDGHLYNVVVVEVTIWRM